MTRLIDHLHDARFPRSNRSARLTAAQVTGWVAGACHHHADLEPRDAIATSLANPAGIDPPDTVASPPPSITPPLPLDRRIAALLLHLDEARDGGGAGRASTVTNGDHEAA